MSTPVQNYKAIVDRVKTMRAKQACSVPEKDPNEQGPVTVPKGEAENPGPQHLPANRKEIQDGTLNVPGNKIEGAGPTGTEVPSTVDGKPKDDAATSPTVSLDKIARTVPAITARIAAMRKGASAPAAPVVKQAAAPAAEKGIAPELGTDMMLKLAATMLETEEGRKVAEATLLKSAGAEAARNLLGAAADQYDALVRNAIAWDEYEKSAAYQANAELAAAEELLKSASVEERAQIVKIAQVIPAVLATIPDEMEKLAFQQGAMDGAQMDASAAPADEGGAPQEPGLEGAGQEGPSLGQIAQLLMAAVQSGEIDQATAEQVMQELAKAEQGGGGAPGAEGAPGEDPAGAGAPPAGAMPGAAPEAPAQGGPESGAELPPEAKAASALANALIPELALL